MEIPIQAFVHLRNFRRIFQGRGLLETVAHRQEIIWPEETLTVHPAIFLPGQLDRVTGQASGSDKAKEMAAATTTRFTHGAAIAFHLKNATLYDGSFYVRQWRHPISGPDLFDKPAREVHTIED